MSSMPLELAGALEQGFGVVPNIGAAVLGQLAIADRPPVMRTSAV
jgi:hypothetical protein